MQYLETNTKYKMVKIKKYFLDLYGHVQERGEGRRNKTGGEGEKGGGGEGGTGEIRTREN